MDILILFHSPTKSQLILEGQKVLECSSELESPSGAGYSSGLVLKGKCLLS
jgi:hypothetical protein